jgi:regulatory protein
MSRDRIDRARPLWLKWSEVGTITGLRVQPKSPRQVGIYVDGVWRLGVSRALAAGLQVGQDIDEAQLAELERRQAVEGAVLRAGRLVSRRPRSEAELRTSLRRAGATAEVVDGVIERLRQAGEIDDLKFARAWVENRVDFRPRSAFALKIELQRKGVSGELIDQALAGFSDEEAAYQAAQKAARRLRGKDGPGFEQQLYAHLQRRGFGYDAISAAVRRVAAEAAAMEESEVKP